MPANPGLDPGFAGGTKTGSFLGFYDFINHKKHTENQHGGCGMSKKKKEAKEKPLDKMTVKELREVAKEMPEITGVHGKNKFELLSAIKEVRGIVDEGAKKKNGSVRELKAKIREFKKKRTAALEAQDAKMNAVFRKRISRLKKKTRRLA
jgi:hypothetical protein